MTREHRHVGALAAGAALGDLAPKEQARWAGLHERCAGCRAVGREMDAIVAELALAVPQRLPPRLPPPALLDRIRAAIRAQVDAG